MKRRRRRQRVLGAALVLLWVGVWGAGSLASWDTLVLLGAAALLLLGSALIFVALVHMDLPSPGRRPAGAEALRPEAQPLPPRVDVAHDPTSPPSAGGRALLARGMGRTRRGVE
jgi:hypothetical protein